MTTERAERWRPIVAAATAISIGVAAALFFWHPSIALGFIGGVITGAGMLSALVMVLNRVVVPPDEREGHPAPWIALHVAKFAAAAGVAYLVIEVLGGDLIAFAGGYTAALIVLLVIMAGEPTISTYLSSETEDTPRDADHDTTAR
ncbi:MAG: hypothetical protein ACOCX2_08550 [Armatimonadota bacterium]